MEAYHNNFIIDMALWRVIALICAFRAVFLDWVFRFPARDLVPENGDLAANSDKPEQIAGREILPRLRCPFWGFFNTPLVFDQIERRRLRHRTRPSIGHQYRFGKQMENVGNVREDETSASPRKCENFIYRLKSKETNLKGAHHENH